MKELTLREIQLIELNLLKKIHIFCEENNITYFLAYGTLIGAIRHHGFIPWDDDIDIIMPRPDYKKFLSLKDKFIYEFTNTDIKAPNNKLYCPFTKVVDTSIMVKEKKIKTHFSKNIWIDIFPLDGVYDDLNKNKKLFFKRKIITKILSSMRIKPFTMNGNIFVKLAGTFFIPIGILLNYLFDFTTYLDNLSQRIKYNESQYVANIIAGFGISEIIHREDLYEPKKISFEGFDFFVPKDYNKYLTNLYGNYMELPSEKDRVSHNIRAWVKEL